MDIKLSIREEDVGMSNLIEEEVKKDEMDSLKEEEIWKRRRERMNNALAAAQSVAGQDPAERHAATQRLVDVIKRANVDEFISMIEMLADRTNLSAIFNVPGLCRGSLLDVAAAACKDDILRLLVDHVPDPLVAAQDDWGDTPLHKAARSGDYESVEKLTRLARHLSNVEDKNLILRMTNKRGNTALHEAVLNCDVKMVRLLLSKDPESVYLKNAEQKSPPYLALDTHNDDILEALFSLLLEPSRIEGLPPVHGAVVRCQYGLLNQILRTNIKLFAMTDSKGGNVFHFAAHTNRAEVFELLGPKVIYLAQKRDMNGDLPIHIASKMGYVHLIQKLHLVSELLNGQGQTILHVAAKYGQTSTMRYILRHPELGKLINERDLAGNTPLHLAAMHSQPTALITLVLDERIKPFLLNHECLTARNIALDHLRWDCSYREILAAMVLRFTSAVTTDLLVLRPEARDKTFSIVCSRKQLPKIEEVNDWINTRLLVSALVATVTFAAGFTVPGGFNGSDMASKNDRGMATMLDKRMFQAFVICNTIAMFCSMIAVIILMFAQQNDSDRAIAGISYSKVLLTIALPAMSTAFLTGVTMTVDKLPWLANTIFYLGLVFLLIISVAKLLQYPPWFWSHHRSIHRLICWLVLGFNYLWGVKPYLLYDPEEDGTASGTSASRPTDGAGESKTGDLVTVKCGDSPHPPNH